jgi:hypothetical protein
MGRSIGTGPASYLSNATDVKKIILMSPFTSIRQVFNDFTCCLGLFVEDIFNNLD